MKDEREILQRLIQARKRAGFSRQKVANALHYSDGQMISRFEKGMTEIPLSRLFQLAELYNVSLVWLLTGHNGRYRPEMVKAAAALVSNSNMRERDKDLVVNMLTVAANVGELS